MNLSRAMHRSAAAAAMIAVAAIYVLATAGIDRPLPPMGPQGICLPPPELWAIPRWADLAGGVVLNALMLAAMAALNTAFNVLRSNTRLQLGLFAIMAAAVPPLVVNVSSGILLALSVVGCIYLLFSCYASPGLTRRVFLAFMILSAGASFEYAFAVFIPVLWLVVAQMRIFSLRTMMASLLGVATPWVILLGFCIVDPADFHLPHIEGIFSTFAEDWALFLLAISLFTAFLLVIAVVLNLSRTIASNARARAFNGSLTLVALITMMAIAVNYNNLPAYLPLLNMCAAFQITHWLVNHRFERQYLAVLAIIFFYLAFYLWRIIL